MMKKIDLNKIYLRFSKFIPTKNDQDLVNSEISKILDRVNHEVNAKISIVKESGIYKGMVELKESNDKTTTLVSVGLSLKDLVFEMKDEILQKLDITTVRPFLPKKESYNKKNKTLNP